MSNVMTALVPVLYSAAQEVSAEPFGVIDSIAATFDDKGVAKGDTVTVPVAPTRAASDFTPSNTTSTGTDATADGVAIQITKSRKVSWNLTGEQIRSLQNGGNDTEWARQLALQGMRTLRNEAEVDAALAVKLGASRAVGTAGTTPFASDINVIADLRQVLMDNGAPLSDLQLCLNSAAGTKARKLGIIQQAYQAGSDEERRSGALLRQFGFRITESAGIGTHTKGTGASYQSNLVAGYNPGDKSIALDTGTGTVVAGDVVTFTGDTNNYVNGTALSGGSIVLNRPGLRATLADNIVMAVGNNYVANVGFERSAIVGIMRPPIMPPNATIKQQLVSDSKGMTYLMLLIEQYGQLTWEVHLAWGFKAVQPEHIAILMG